MLSLPVGSERASVGDSSPETVRKNLPVGTSHSARLTLIAEEFVPRFDGDFIGLGSPIESAGVEDI